MFSQQHPNNKQNENWLRTLLAFINPLRGPGILVAILATFVEEVGQGLPWYALLCICLTNLLVIRLVSLIIMDTVCFFLEIFSHLGRATHSVEKQRIFLDQRTQERVVNKLYPKHRTSQHVNKEVVYNH